MLSIAGAPLARLVGAARPGRQHLGHPPSGAADRWSFYWARRLLDDDETICYLEWSLSGLQACFDAPASLVLSGAPMRAWLDGAALARHCVVPVATGSRLQVEPLAGGCCRYLALAGGLVGDGPFSHGPRRPAVEGRQRPPWTQLGGWAPARGRLRALPGPEFEPDTNLVLDGPWSVQPGSDRRGLRLHGPSLPLASFDIRSAPVTDGLVQATAAGPIVLLRDRQTIGGYPRILQVIDSDIDLAAQLAPGMVCHFELVDEATAAACRAARAQACT